MRTVSKLAGSLFVAALVAFGAAACSNTTPTVSAPPATAQPASAPAATALPASAPTDAPARQATTPASAPTTAAAVPAPGAEGSPAVAPADLWAATITNSELDSILPADEKWWPDFPELYQTATQAGQRFYVIQSHYLTDESVRNVLALFGSADSAAAQYQRTKHENEELMAGPKVGEQSQYYTYKITTYGGSGKPPCHAGVRFTVGSVFGFIEITGKPECAGTAELAKGAEEVAKRSADVQAGKLRAPAMPDGLSNLLPPATVAGAGPRTGQAVVPLEAWGIAVPHMQGEQAIAALQDGGVTRLAYSQYGISNDPKSAIGATLFPFSSDKAAGEWVQAFAAWAKDSSSSTFRKTRLEPGNTGPNGAFYDYDYRYRLQFSKGQYAADVTCWGVSGPAGKECEDAVRAVAEAWYAALP